VLLSIQASSESRGIRTERPIRTEGISPRLARSPTFALLSDSSFAASVASSNRGRSRDGGDAWAVESEPERLLRVSINWCSVATRSRRAITAEMGEPDGPVPPLPLLAARGHQ